MTDERVKHPPILVREGKEWRVTNTWISAELFDVIPHNTRAWDWWARVAEKYLMPDDVYHVITPLTSDHPAFEAWERYKRGYFAEMKYWDEAHQCTSVDGHQIPPGLYEYVKCEACGGGGEIEDPNLDSTPGAVYDIPCPTCDGHGGSYERKEE